MPLHALTAEAAELLLWPSCPVRYVMMLVAMPAVGQGSGSSGKLLRYAAQSHRGSWWS